MNGIQRIDEKNKLNFASLLFLLYIVIFTCYTNDNNQPILYGGYIIVSVVCLLKLFSNFGMKISIYKETKALFWFSTFCFASVLWAWDADTAISHSFFVFVCVIFVILMTNYFIKTKDNITVLATFAIAGIAMSLVVIGSYGGITAFYEEAKLLANLDGSPELSRMGGELTNVNTIGMGCGYAFVILFYFAIFENKKLCYLFMMPTILVTITTGSRKSIILIVLGMLLLLYYKYKNNTSVYKYLKAAITILFLIVIFTYSLSLDIMQPVKERMGSFLNVFGSNENIVDGSSQLRANMIKVGFKQFWNDPFTGIGIGNSYYLNASNLRRFTYSHCDYIELLVNGGIIGFCLYYSILLKLVREYLSAIKNSDDTRLIVGFVLLVLFLLLNFACVTYYNSVNTYVFFMLWISQLTLYKEKVKNNEFEKENNQ